MEFIQVYLAKDEMEASIIKGLFESNGIRVSVSSSNSNSPNVYLSNMHNVPYGVYVEEDKLEKAKEILAQKN